MSVPSVKSVETPPDKLSDYGAAWIGEGIAFAGLCLGLDLSRFKSDPLIAIVILWALCLGHSKTLRDNTTASGESSKSDSDGDPP